MHLTTQNHKANLVLASLVTGKSPPIRAPLDTKERGLTGAMGFVYSRIWWSWLGSYLLEQKFRDTVYSLKPEKGNS